MVDITTLEWDWWRMNQTPQLIEAAYIDEFTGLESHAYLDTAFIEVYLMLYESELYLACLKLMADSISFDLDQFTEAVVDLGRDKDKLITDMIHNQAGTQFSTLYFTPKNRNKWNRKNRLQ